jgi:hypothetical protein
MAFQTCGFMGLSKMHAALLLCPRHAGSIYHPTAILTRYT